MTTRGPFACLFCEHKNPSQMGETITCSAFPGGIPEDILVGRDNHQDKVKGDHGIQFSLLDGMDALWSNYLLLNSSDTA